MVMKLFKHMNAASLDEAMSVLAQCKGKARVMAGGTDLQGSLKDNIHPTYPELVVNIKTIPGLSYIDETAEGLRIGSLTKLREIATSRIIQESYGLLAEAAKTVASPQIRNMATIGGNICQEVRCWYYRSPENMFHCMRKGGESCNAIVGDNRYHSILGVARMDHSPCASNCPGHTDIPSYMGKIREGDVMAAARIILEVNPIPSVTGRVCPHFCENTCTRNGFDGSVSIRFIERYLGDFILENISTFLHPPGSERGEKIAIVGSGPAGLSAAFYLRKSGYQIVVFDKMREPGGMLTYGIPPYRLPKDLLRKQIEALKGCGISFRQEVNVGKDIHLSELQKNFDAVLLACGAWKSKGIGIPGEELMVSGLDLLCKINSGDQETPGKKVAVIGGGNVAIDVARTLLRLGCEPCIFYRRSKMEMPAVPEEVKKAKEEGIRFEFLTLPVGAVRRCEKVLLTSIKMKLGEADESGRPRPQPVLGSEFTEQFDAVIKAIGENPDVSIVSENSINERGEPESGSAVQHLGENLFAGGDFLIGPSTVAQAVTAGKEAAHIIEEYLKAGQYEAFQKTERKVGVVGKLENASFCGDGKVCGPELSVAERIKSIDVEDSSGLGWAEVRTESGRCFNCGCVAVSPSDLAPALIALRAQIKTSKRTVDAEFFFTAGVRKSTVLEPNELVKEILIPPLPPGSKCSYNKFRLRKSIDFPIVSLASVVSLEDGRVSEARMVLGAVAPIPVRILEAEDLLKGKVISENLADEAARIALKEAKPLRRNGYKIDVAKSLIKRAILSAKGG